MADNKEGKMLPAVGKPEDTCRILPSFLEELASAGSLRDALEVIKFVRRFVPDRPLTDYRTCGEPLAIREFLKRCGLAQGKDYEVKQSGLDPDSYVITLSTTDGTKEVLNRIAGLRVEDGASVCDRLYCELIKDKDRDFAKAMCGGSEVRSNAPIAIDILEMTRGIYTVCASANKDKFKREAGIIEWCAKQFKDCKLVPKAPAIAPLAVVEFHARLTGAMDTHDLFELPKVPEKSIAYRPIDVGSAKIPLGFCSGIPLPVLRSISSRFNAYAATDSATFAGSAGNSDSVYVRVDSRFDLCKDSPQLLLSACNFITDEIKLFKYVKSIYEKSYPGMTVSFDSNSCARTPVGYGDNAKRIVSRLDDGVHSKTQVKFLTEECDKISGFEPTEDNPCASVFAGFVLAPYKSIQPPEILFHHKYGTPVISSAVLEDEDKDVKTSEVKSKIAELWFETVHGKAPEMFKDDEFKDRFPKFLKDLNNDPKSTSERIKAKCAEAVRAWFETNLGSCDESCCTFVANEPEDGLHSPAHFCTQVISTVTSGTKSLSSWIKDVEGGAKTVAPNLVFGRSEEKDLMTGFIDLSATTNVQIKSPKKAENFMIVVETNFTDRFNAGVLPSLLRVRLKNALIEALVSGREKELDKVRAKLPPESTLTRIVGEMISGDNAGGKTDERISIGYKRDRFNRLSIVFSLEADAAMALILAAASADRIDKLLRFAIECDPGVVHLPKEGWRKELLNLVLNGGTGGRLPLPCYSNAFEDYSGTNGDSMLETYATAAMYDLGEPTPAFRSRLAAAKVPIDPN